MPGVVLLALLLQVRERKMVCKMTVVFEMFFYINCFPPVVATVIHFYNRTVVNHYQMFRMVMVPEVLFVIYLQPIKIFVKLNDAIRFSTAFSAIFSKSGFATFLSDGSDIIPFRLMEISSEKVCSIFFIKYSRTTIFFFQEV